MPLWQDTSNNSRRKFGPLYICSWVSSPVVGVQLPGECCSAGTCGAEHQVSILVQGVVPAHPWSQLRQQ